MINDIAEKQLELLDRYLGLTIDDLEQALLGKKKVNWPPSHPVMFYPGNYKVSGTGKSVAEIWLTALIEYRKQCQNGTIEPESMVDGITICSLKIIKPYSARNPELVNKIWEKFRSTDKLGCYSSSVTDIRIPNSDGVMTEEESGYFTLKIEVSKLRPFTHLIECRIDKKNGTITATATSFDEAGERQPSTHILSVETSMYSCRLA